MAILRSFRPAPPLPAPPPAGMLLPRGSPPPLSALSQVLRLERSRRTGIVFPLQKLARYLAPGVDTERFRLFQPGLAALQQAEALFRAGRHHAVQYLSSAVRMDHAPPGVATAGRTVSHSS
uniref:Uncharacterized protein n=1 Tax=Calidris pygmaea TaxID=425635 RepID=A0A8C3JTJ7_9CHAR